MTLLLTAAKLAAFSFMMVSVALFFCSFGA